MRNRNRSWLTLPPCPDAWLRLSGLLCMLVLLSGTGHAQTPTGGRNGVADPQPAMVAADAAQPRRVVSLNYCYDALLERWHYPTEAWLGAAAHGGRLARILAFAPDVVLVSPFSDPYLVRSLQRQDIKLVHLVEPASLTEVKQLLVTFSTALADPTLARAAAEAEPAALARSRGMGQEALAVVPGALALPPLAVLDMLVVEQLQAQLDELARGELAPEDLPGAGRSAIFLQPNQYSWGRDNLMHELLTALGFENLGARAGEGLVRVTLEQVLWWQPDLVLREQDQDSFALAYLPLVHRALARSDVRQLGFPGAYSGCLAQQLPDASRFLQQETAL